MLRVGITGGIGSGKSTVAKAFAALGVAVYNCDKEAKRLIAQDMRIRAELCRLLGDEIYSSDGVLQKQRMAALIFSDRGLLQKVNEIVHPAVFDDFMAWSMERQAEGSSWVLCEAAVMTENGYASRLVRLIVTSLPLEVRVERTMLRDGATREEVLRRIRSQASDEELCALADFVVVPDDRHFILPQVLELDRLFSNGCAVGNNHCN